jgi:hypothetical protein
MPAAMRFLERNEDNQPVRAPLEERTGWLKDSLQ